MTFTFFFILFSIPFAMAAAGYALAQRVGAIVPVAFIATYVLSVGAILFVKFGLFGIDPKFRSAWIRAWLEIFWPLWATFYAPSAMAALLACWYARASTLTDAIKLLSSYLLLILVAIAVTLAFDAHFFFTVGEVVGLSVVFLTMAHWKRTANVGRQES